MKIRWDRMADPFSAPNTGLSLRNKVAGTVAVGDFRNCGLEAAQLDIWKMCVFFDIIPVGTGPDYAKKIGCWGGALTHYTKPNYDWHTEIEVGSPEELTAVKEDLYGMLSCRNAGRRVAEMAKVIKAGLKAVSGEEMYWPYVGGGGLKSVEEMAAEA